MRNTTTSDRCSADAQGVGATEPRLRHIQSEFLDMPGLRLTLGQARRLWNLDAAACNSVLTTLVDSGFLVRTAEGIFMRSTGRLSGTTRVA